MALIHRSRQFGRGVVSDGLGLAVGFLVSKARFSGGYFNRFLSSNFRKILRKFQKAALILARQIRPLPLALAEFRLHRFPNPICLARARSR